MNLDFFCDIFLTECESWQLARNMECEQRAKDLVSTMQLNLEFLCDSFLTEYESWQLARNAGCELLAKDSKEKLAQAKHEIACELVVKQTDIQRLKSELQEMKMKYEHQDEDEIPMIGKVNLSRPDVNKEGTKMYSECMQIISSEIKYRASVCNKGCKLVLCRNDYF